MWDFIFVVISDFENQLFALASHVFDEPMRNFAQFFEKNDHHHYSLTKPDFFPHPIHTNRREG